MSNATANTTGREALRGQEVPTFDLISDVLTSKEWAEWLTAPLEGAAANGNRDLTQNLVRAGAEIGGALHKAIRGGHGDIANYLIESGASLVFRDADGCTPLHAAAGWGETETVQQLLLKGADKDAFDDHVKTPLYLAARFGNLATVLALVAAGADVRLRCGRFKSSVMHVAVREGHIEILRAMIQNGADAHAVDTVNNTALHAAALHNNAEAVDMLIDAGADIEARSRRGRWYTPLHCASDKLSREALLALLNHGANVNERNDTLLKTPLMLAAAKAGTQGAADVVDSLLRAGADETIVNECGCGPEEALGEYIDLPFCLFEDVKRMRELLENAPADRTWRRRGYLVLCRAHPDRVQQNPLVSGTIHVNTAPRTRSRARLARAGGITGDGAMDETTGGHWTVVVAKVLRLQEEDVFRTIVEYL